MCIRDRVYIQCVSLLPVGRFGAVSAIDIHYMKRFCVFNNQVSSTLIRNGFSERGFDLFGNTEVVEYGKLTFVQFYDFGPFRGDK